MADYRDHYTGIVAAGASVAAISVDAAAKSQALREQLAVPFPLLCDVERRVIREWDLLNEKERGGIAKPSVFVIDGGRVVRFAAVNTVVRRVPPAEILAFLNNAPDSAEIGPRAQWPRFADWIRAVRNNFRKE